MLHIFNKDKKNMEAFVAYWTSLNEGCVVARDKLDPRDMTVPLDQVFLTEERNGKHALRVSGQQINTLFDRDARGLTFTDLFLGHGRWDDINAFWHHPVKMVLTLDMQGQRGHMILLPVRSAGIHTTHDRCLGYSTFKNVTGKLRVLDIDLTDVAPDPNAHFVRPRRVFPRATPRTTPVLRPTPDAVPDTPGHPHPKAPYLRLVYERPS